jgi:NitT/TauT family transport system permease protein
VFTPNHPTSLQVRTFLAVAWIAGFLGWLQVFPPPIFPRPLELAIAWKGLIDSGELLPALATSFLLDLEAVTLSTILSLGVAYLFVLSVARPLPVAISKLRYLGFVGLTFAFGQVWSGHDLKLALLVFGMSTFSVTGMLSVIAEIPAEAYDHARTLRMGPWRTTYEVVILGTADRMLEVVRQNGAMGFIMLTMAEGLVRSEGGLGVLLLNENRQMRLDVVYALQLTIFLVALGMDFALAWLSELVFPYANLKRGVK